MESFFAKVKIFRFWTKTMDYNKAFWPKLRSLFVVLLRRIKHIHFNIDITLHSPAEWVACRVSLRGYQIRPSYSRFTPYLLLTPHDVEQPRVEVKVQLRPQRQDQQQQQQPPPPLPPLGKPYHHQKDGSSLEEVRLPDISLLNLPEITLSHSHFG